MTLRHLQKSRVKASSNSIPFVVAELLRFWRRSCPLLGYLALHLAAA